MNLKNNSAGKRNDDEKFCNHSAIMRRKKWKKIYGRTIIVYCTYIKYIYTYSILRVRL